MGDAYDEHSICQLVYIESMDVAERPDLEARLFISSEEASSLGALLRFSVGYSLGHLNERMDALSVMHQGIRDEGMGTTAASDVAHRFMAHTYIIDYLKAGRATPPFSLMPYDNNAEAVYWLKHDQEIAEKAFDEVIKVRLYRGHLLIQ